MADRVLPSRKQLLSITPGHLDEMHEWHRAVVLAVIDGRYVDREAIDHEAAADQLGLIDWWAMQTKHPSSVEMPPYEWLLAEAGAVVDAALEEV